MWWDNQYSGSVCSRGPPHAGLECTVAADTREVPSVDHEVFLSNVTSSRTSEYIKTTKTYESRLTKWPNLDWHSGRIHRNQPRTKHTIQQARFQRSDFWQHTTSRSSSNAMHIFSNIKFSYDTRTYVNHESCIFVHYMKILFTRHSASTRPFIPPVEIPAYYHSIIPTFERHTLFAYPKHPTQIAKIEEPKERQFVNYTGLNSKYLPGSQHDNRLPVERSSAEWSRVDKFPRSSPLLLPVPKTIIETTAQFGQPANQSSKSNIPRYQENTKHGKLVMYPKEVNHHQRSMGFPQWSTRRRQTRAHAQ